MEAHPDYETVIQTAKNVSFEIKYTSGDPYVNMTEVYNYITNMLLIEGSHPQLVGRLVEDCRVGARRRLFPLILLPAHTLKHALISSSNGLGRIAATVGSADFGSGFNGFM